MKREDDAERLEREGRHMKEESERVERHIEEARRDWESKEADTSVPGAQPEPGEDEETPEEPDR
jgi:hypothetical protein